MSDTLLRNIIALVATLLFGFVWWAAYTAGTHSWWWAAIGLLIVYFIVYKLVDA